MTPIRLKLVVDGSGTSGAVDALARSFDSSIQLGVNKAVSHVDRGVAKLVRTVRRAWAGVGTDLARGLAPLNASMAALDGSLAKIDARLEKVIQRLGRMNRLLKSTGGRGGGGGGGGGNNGPVDLDSMLAAFQGGGYNATGRASMSATRRAIQTSNQLANEQGRQLNAGYTNGKLSSLRLGMEPDPGAEVRRRAMEWSRVYAKQDRDRARAAAEAGRDVRRRADEWAARLGAQEQQQAIAAANARNQATLAAGGYRPTTGRTVSGPGGDRVVQNYARAGGLLRAGGTASLDASTGRLTTQIAEAQSLWNRLRGTISRDGSLIQRTLNAAFHPLKTVGSAYESAGNFFIRLSATFYSLERIGGMLKNTFAGPVNYIMDATEASRQFEVALSGVAGGMGRARDINAQLVKESRTLPITIKEMRQLTQQMAYIGPLTSRVAMGAPADVAGEARSFSKIVSGLKLLNPDQDVSGIMVSLKEALGASDFVSLRRRLEIPVSSLAASIGKKPEDLFGRPEMTMQALEAYVDQFVPESAIKQMGSLYTVRIEKLMEVFRLGAERVGNSGVFDSVVGQMEQLTDRLFAYLDTPDFQQKAKRVSDSLARIVGNLGKGIVALLQKMSGARSASGTVPALADTIAGLVDRLASASDGLPGLGTKVGEALATIGWAIDQAIVELKRLREFTANPEKVVYQGARNVGRDAVTNPVTDGMMSAANPLYAAYSAFNKARPALTAAMPRPLNPYGRQDLSGWRDPGGPAAAAAAAAPAAPQFYEASERVRLLMSAVKDLMEITPDGYKAKFRSAQDAINGVGESWNPNADELTKVSRNANERLDGLFGDFAGSKMDIFAKIEQMHGESIASLDAAIDGLRADALAQPRFAKDINAKIAALQKARGNANEGFAGETVAAYDALRQSARYYGIGLAGTLGGEGATTRAMLLEQIIGGRTSVATKTAARLGDDASQYGIATMPASQQAKLMRMMVEAQQQRATDAQGFGGLLTTDMTAGRIVRQASDPLSGNETARKQLQMYRDALPAMRELQERARAAYGEMANEETLRSLNEANELLAQSAARMYELEIASNRGLQTFIEIGDSAQRAFEDSLGSGVADLILGVGTLEDAMKGLAETIVREFSQIATRNLMRQVLGDGGDNGASGFASVLAKLFTSGGGGGGTAPTVAAAADGAIFRGGFTPIRKFADGGIVKGGNGVLGLIGEAGPGRDEAVIPLKGGKVPVDLRGGGGGGGATVNVHTIVVRDEAQARAEEGRLRSLDRRAIINIVASDMHAGGKTRKAFGRRTG